MVEVKVIGLELLGTTGVAFPSLESLSFEDMASLESWSTNSGVVGSVFPCLQKLKIEKCPKLLDVSVEALPSLRFLKIDRCHDNVLRSLVQKASLITKLKLVKISGLTNEAWRGVIEHLGAVEELTIQGCDEIRYLWESEAVASKVLVKLRSLKILWCDSLVSLGEKEEDSFGNNNIITSIKTLEVWSCSSMERCIFPDSIESLKIDHCSSITHVSFTTKTGGQKLKSLEITDGNKLGQSFYTTNMPVVEVVEIIRWPDLKSIINFSSSIHLTKLMIHDCGIIESFPDLQLSNIASLKRLEITNCPGMDASFPRGLWPPKLHTLVIGGLKKPVSEWGPQSFPTSLVELKLVGEQVANFSQLSDLLPSSLPFLHISEFEKLESLSAGLEHLTSLQHLLIHTCPKLKQLPKMLLPSLLRLVISDCPKLKERSTGRGSHYWPLISHIPYIAISSGY
uniref:putative disease resistance protein RGA4 n=1 Tax=Erigeron canadensis TaxID=72917 RepID=UPI001CB8A8F9|nr:putative disease resistance protein RGA4 [Erigeron canadensis]